MRYLSGMTDTVYVRITAENYCNVLGVVTANNEALPK
jgi:hypothetical protein